MAEYAQTPAGGVCFNFSQQLHFADPFCSIKQKPTTPEQNCRHSNRLTVIYLQLSVGDLQ